MTWLTVTGRAVYYLTLPLVALISWLWNTALLLLSPATHLGYYIASMVLLPLRLAAGFETLYIYLGVAAIVGLLTGSVLHISSTILISVFNLTQEPEKRCLPAESVSPKAQMKFEGAWQRSISQSDDSIEKKYAEWLESNTSKRKEGEGLLGQTILEEDDDSEDEF